MSKKIVVLIALLFSASLFSQITKLSSLSSSKFLGSAVVLEDNNEDVYGYFILYEKNRTSKIVVELEYVLLDKNMNKVHQAFFNQGAQNFGPYKISCYLENIKKIKNNLYITIAYRSDYGNGSFNTGDKIQDFRKLNLNDFSLSDTYKLSSKEELVIEPLYDKKWKEFYNVTLLEPTNLGSGFIAGGDLKDISFSKDNQFSYYDIDFNKKWTYKFNEKDDKPSVFDFFKEDGNDFVFFKRYVKNKNAINLETVDLSIQLIDRQTGKNKFEIPLKDSEYIYDFEKLFFQEDKIVIIASFFKYKDKREYKYDDRLGFARLTYDRTTGATLDKVFLKWIDLSQKFSINEKGNIKDYGQLYFNDYKLLSDGKLLVFSTGHSAGTYEMFMFVFDDKMKIADFKKIDKTAQKINLVPKRQDVENSGEFEYMYSQKISQDEFVFYYKNRIKEKEQKSKGDLLGVITYTGGKFDNSFFPLKISNSKIIPLPAKKGYVLFKEIPEDAKGEDIEETFRLEKINY